MKTNGLYALTADGRPGGALYSQMILVAVIIALFFASFPMASVLAAPASGKGTTESNNLEQEWKNKLRHLRSEGFFYDHVQFNPADFDDPDNLARVHFFLEKYGIALRQANTVVFNHAGFDIKGNVTNEIKAAESVRNLAMYLHMMRGLRDKIDEVPQE